MLEHWDFGGSQCYQYLQAQSPIFCATYLYPFHRNGLRATEEVLRPPPSCTPRESPFPPNWPFCGPLRNVCEALFQQEAVPAWG